mmetsp:Transcript_28114/g.64689  ORF Transcript_28114/g.64689 Transcript_28114/m.64689 type:complete len:95 (+) Transcript_28114:1431-1715(+)
MQVPLPSVNIPYKLPWVEAQPPQLPPAQQIPLCPKPEHMLTDAAQTRLQHWLDAQLRDLVAINISLARGTPPSKIDRSNRPKALAIGAPSRMHF